MRTVRLLTGAIHHGHTFDAGMTINLPDDEAERYIANNFAEAVVETATAEPETETASINYKRGKHGRHTTTRT